MYYLDGGRGSVFFSICIIFTDNYRCRPRTRVWIFEGKKYLPEQYNQTQIIYRCARNNIVIIEETRKPRDRLIGRPVYRSLATKTRNIH